MLDTIMAFIASYGVMVVFLCILIESSGLPVPGESMLVAAGILASHGKLDWWEVFAAATLGGIVGDNIGYLLGHRFGRGFIYRYGPKVGLHKGQIMRMEARFIERGPPIILFARFIFLLRQLAGFLAGTAHMHWWKFSFYNALGAALWAGAYSGGAYLLGEAIERYLAAGRWVFIAIGVIFVIACGSTIYGFIREAKQSATEDADLPEVPEPPNSRA